MALKVKVYIWDVDETLILLKSLLDGTYAGAFNGQKNVQSGIDIGKLWEHHILKVCDAYFFYEQVEDFNQPCLDSLSQYDDNQDLSCYNFSQDGLNPPFDDLHKRKLAYRHRVMAEKYRKGSSDFLTQDERTLLAKLYDLTDIYTEKWFSSARTCLKECAGQKKDVECSCDVNDRFQHVNVVVTSGPLVPSLVKCILFRLDDVITCDKIYSSLEVGKLQCFKWIRERFDRPNVQFCVIGDGWEECEAAQHMKWPFVKIDFQPGSVHRFPGLTSTDLRHYFSIGNGGTLDQVNDQAGSRDNS